MEKFTPGVAYEELLKDALRNPDVKREYDSMAALYSLIKQVVRARKEQGITQGELAEKMGTKQSSISRLESGDYNPSLEFIQKAAEALGKTVEIKLV